MYILKRHVLRNEWDGGGYSGADTTDNGQYSGDMSPVQSMPANPWSGVQEGPATAPQSPQYQSNFLQNLFNNPETEYGDYGQINNPVVQQDVNSWAPAREGLATIKSPQNMFGPGALREEYDVDGNPQGFMTTPFAKGLMKAGIGLGRTALNTHPIGAIANVGYDLSQGVNPMRALAGTVPGMGGVVARGAAEIGSGAPAGQVVGNAIAGQLGSQVGGQLGQGFAGGWGGALGSMFGGKAMQDVARTAGATPGINGNKQALAQPSFGMYDITGGLMGLYSANRMGQQAQQNADQNQAALTGQIQGLSSMYGQDSPYAQQMRQSLARKDAKAGRNSQYGQREVQLQAALAEKAAQTAQTIGGLTQQSHDQNVANTNAQTLARSNQLGILSNLGQRSGFNDWAGGQLSDLWKQYGPSATASMPG